MMDTVNKIIKLVSQEPDLTNAEIAKRLNVNTSLVRDTRAAHNVETNSENPCPSDTSQSQSLNTSSPAMRYAKAEADKKSIAEDEFNTEPDMKGRLAYLYQSIPDAVVETEATQSGVIIRRVNSGFKDIFEYNDNQVVGCPIKECIIPDGTNNEPPELQQDDSQGACQETVCRKTKTGVRCFLHRHIPYEHDGNRYAFEVYSDIEDQKRRQAELEYRAQQLDEEREQAEEFVSILSHDLRNPINIAEGYLHQLQTEANQETVEVIERALNRTKHLIDDTLELKESSDPNLEKSIASIDTVAQSAWELVDTGDSELRITDQFNIECDTERTSRLLENLFRNAVEHNDGPVVIRIGIHHTMTQTTRGKTETAFFVSDDGCGIPEEKRDTVFELGETESRTGTGLGLAIVNRVADAHGWNLRIIESPDGGAKFIFNHADIQ